MPTPTANQIRQQFIDYFAERHDHAFVPSSPVVPHNDPTLLFANAGMNQFKPVFQGTVDPHSDLARLRRAVNSQKCIRAGGKHNDLDDVGKDLYHHTFFEMLGNWSFGDFFKAEAIDWAWDLFTNVWKIDPSRLYATYFQGDEAEGLEPDLEAKQLWLKHLPESHVLPGDMKDNFWEMGDTGPCGPCSEIHYDGRTDEERRQTPGASLVNADHEHVIELWNLVFIQFDRHAPGAQGLKTLPAKHVDTGMGLERITRVLQGKSSNYATDLFTPIFAAIQNATGAEQPYTDRLDSPEDTAYRVIADHIRTLTFAITDGADPSNEGRGYVLRRVLRRAVRYGRQTLGAKGPFLCELVPTVVSEMGDFFPELKKNPRRVADVIRDEEVSFGRTIEQGAAHFAEAAQAGRIAAEDAFKLHDTYGFPIDLTQIMAAEHGLTVDVEGFERLMEEARERSRAGGAGASCETRALHMDAEAVAELQKRGVQPTDDSLKFERPRATAHVQAIWTGERFVDHLEDSHEEPVALILDRTTFYAEMGGQVGDLGTLHADVDTGDGQIHILFDVENTVSVAGYVLHVGRLTEGAVKVGNSVETRVDERRRRAVAANHTTTHLLNLALREALGEGVEQKGSLVAPDRLRFDFSASGSLDADTLATIERAIAERIDQNLKVDWAEAPLARARTIAGVRAVFGETYPDPVRVVSVGAPVADLLNDPENPKWREFSVEFCGGTHLLSTKDATAVAITEETAVAKGVRRVVALTGDAAQDAIDRAKRLESRIQNTRSLEGEALQREVTDLAERIDAETLPLTFKHRARAALESLAERIKAARKQAAAAGRDAAVAAARQIAESAEGEIIVAEIPAGSDRQALLAAMDAVRARHEDAAVILLSADEEEGKVSIAAAVPPALIDRGLRAGDWVRVAAGACGGKGGGKPDKAQGGGTEPERIGAAADAAREHASRTLGSHAL